MSLSRRRDLDAVAARGHLEAVLAVLVGGRAAHRVALVVQQLNAHARKATLALVLHAVGVAVFEDAVADLGGWTGRRRWWRRRRRRGRRRRRRRGGRRLRDRFRGRHRAAGIGAVLDRWPGFARAEEVVVLLRADDLVFALHAQARLQRAVAGPAGAGRIEGQFFVVAADDGVGLAGVANLDDAVLRGQDDVALAQVVADAQLVHLALQGLDHRAALDVDHVAFRHARGQVVLAQEMHRLGLGLGRWRQFRSDEFGRLLGQRRQLGLDRRLARHAALRRRGECKGGVGAGADRRVAVHSHGGLSEGVASRGRPAGPARE
ncbi:MAG: hypothetical protein L6Q75_16605 [Burkholderiaceae bacterium]|nr:hypothetical protein [Burkholderiaceae bacterium]